MQAHARAHCTHTLTHSWTHTGTATRENCYCRGGLAIGSTRIFSSGPINNGPFLILFLLIYVFIYFLCPARETCIGSAHSAQLQTQQRGDETRLIVTDRHQGDWTNDHFLLLYQPLSVTLPTRPQLYHSQRLGPVAILKSCSFCFSSVMGTDGVYV